MNTVRDIPDPYATLGVERTASEAEIKKAYRRLAREYHPDSTGGDKRKEARFKDISNAYNIIGDPDKRAKYDAMREATARGGPGGIPEGVFDLGDLFAQFFGGAQGGQQPGNVSYRVYTSGGGGGAPEGFPGFSSFSGFPFGQAGQAPPPPRAAPRAKPRRRKVRLADGSTAEARGLDLYTELRIAIDQAVLGTSAQVATLEGKANVRVPPGTSSGVKLRLKNKGLAGAGGKRGNLYVTVQIDVPKKVSNEAERRLVQFMRAVKKGKSK